MFQKIFFLFAFIFSIQLWGQAYQPLLDDINEWHFTTCYFGCLTDVYYTDGDTIVNGNSHKILDGYHYVSRTFLLREEVENKKVFMTIVNDAGNEEYLLYDFSLDEGDEINLYNPISPFPEDAGVFVLDSIRLRELVDSNEYRHYYLSPIPSNTISTDPATWIEGLGSLSIINAPGGFPDINAVGNLSCYFKNEELFYSNLDSIDACKPIHLGLIKPIQDINEVEIYTSKAISYLSNTDNVKRIDVYNISGKLLKSINNLYGKSLISIDLSRYERNVYILVAMSVKNEKRTFKIINK